jgi:hypothetical protein
MITAQGLWASGHESSRASRSTVGSRLRRSVVLAAIMAAVPFVAGASLFEGAETGRGVVSVATGPAWADYALRAAQDACSYTYGFTLPGTDDPAIGAQVTVLETGYETASDEGGYFTVPLPGPGIWTILVAYPGHPRVRLVVVLEAGCRVTSEEVTRDTVDSRMMASASQDPTPGSRMVAQTTFTQVNIQSITNRPLDWVTRPPGGRVTLGGVPFDILTGPSAVFSTADAHDLTHLPHEQTIAVNVSRPRTVYILIVGDWLGNEVKDLRVGEIVLRFDNGQSLTVPLVGLQNLRQTWDLDASPLRMGQPPAGTSWTNVWSEGQGRGGLPAHAYIDMVSTTIPNTLATTTLASIAIRDLSTSTVRSLDPALKLVAITVTSE